MKKWIVGLAAVGMLAGCSSDNGSEPAPTTEESVRAAPVTSTTTAPTTIAPAATTPAPPATPGAPGDPVAAGCQQPDASVVAAIEAALTEGRTLQDVAAVTTDVDGIDYEYVSANVFRADGTRSVSAAVWLSPGVGVFNLSSNSREVTPEFEFARGMFDAVSAGDETGAQVQECVSVMARGR